MLAGQVKEKTTDFDPVQWVDAHGDYLFGFAFSRVRDEAVAEDLVQETLLAALESRSSFAQKSSELTWLCGILKHKIIDHFRRHGRETDLTGEETDLSSYQYLFADQTWKDHWTEETTPVEWPETPEKALGKTEFCAILSHCLNELPTRIADAFTLHEVEGMDGAEICEILQVSKDNYWVMLHHARTHLRRCLEYGWFRKIEAEGELH